MLKIENLHFKHKNSDQDTLKRINAHFRAGELSVILGPAGSGKTTLLSILAGLEMPDQGRIFVDGKDLAVLDPSRYRMEYAAMVFRNFHLFSRLTALENVCYPMGQSGIEKHTARRKAKELLGIAGVGEDRHRQYPARLSAAEQQRVAIARALATGARVILADEPTGNLNKENGEGPAVMAILRNLAQRQGYCIIVATQNKDITESSDEVYRMTDGMIRQAMW